MKKVSKSPYVMDVLNIPNLQKSLERLADLLSKIQKALGEYLERERAGFPRFYFVGDEDLLELIGNSRDVVRVQKHFRKMFAGLHSLRLSEDATAIIEHVDHGKGLGAAGEPGMGRGVQLPEFADAAALPAPDGSWGAVIGFGMGEVVLDGPAANLSPIDLEVAFAEHLAGREAVGSWGVAAEPFVQERVHFGGPVGHMITTRKASGPEGLLMMGAGLEVIAVEFIEAASCQAESLGGGFDFKLSGTEEGQHVTDERSSTAPGQLEFLSFSSDERSRTGGRCPPDPLGFYRFRA